ncbi:phospholipase D family protein [Variovorax sp. YR216]|uniref:phospholipase D family protein n=1 Tax=Variovorax sp. YR216 TaxID=1882828 RepID=UPI00089D058E|nr:phospholipase D family protein [Variovorax sp. YR216]SEA98272.1 putative cardiolipin synthase [Variovorax sp. YR216]
MRLRIAFLAVYVCLLATGCASLPPPVQAPPAHAIEDAATTRLGRIAHDSLPADDPALSGFRLLPEAETSFNARIALARRAQRSIDAQYYLIGNDTVGQQFLRELRDAAARGVRVRIIVDDLYTAGEDPLLTGLAAFPNVEVRLFNPLPSRSGWFAGRVLASLDDFERIDHRMHNKLFIADNAFAVAGGRNMADAYFMQSTALNFIDFDVLGAGPIVREMSKAFDLYWNSPHVWPIDTVAGTRPSAEGRARFDALIAQAGERIAERPLDVLGQPTVSAQLDAGRAALVPASAQLFVDSPDKVDANSAADKQTVTTRTLGIFAKARENVRIVSPYFIPGERGMAMMEAVHVPPGAESPITVITNSLGSTDEPLVYAEYAKYRKRLLKAGVRLYEIGPQLAPRSEHLGNFGRSAAGLHAKMATIDDRWVFIGSMNLDGRSAVKNTELGLVIDSPELVKPLRRLFHDGVVGGAYRLQLSPDGSRIEWQERTADGRVTVHAHEPHDSAWQRIKFWLMLPLVNQNEL